MSDSRFFILSHSEARRGALIAVQEADDGWTVLVSPPAMNSGQRARFHAICGDIAKSGLLWAGKPRTAAKWKLLLISGHAVVTKEETEFMPGLEGEFVNLRESTTQMSKRRGSSLIEYATAYAVRNNVTLNDPRLEPDPPPRRRSRPS